MRLFDIPADRNLLGWMKELDHMAAVLLGHKTPPVDNGAMTLFEVADAYHARAREMERVILRAETEGTISSGDDASLFRKRELRSFIEMAKGASELGSRRVTWAKMEMDGA